MIFDNKSHLIRTMSFSSDIEEQLLSQVDSSTTDEEFKILVRVYDIEFNSCSECGNDLEKNEDGYTTSYGTCDTCVHKDTED